MPEQERTSASKPSTPTYIFVEGDQSGPGWVDPEWAAKLAADPELAKRSGMGWALPEWVAQREQALKEPAWQRLAGLLAKRFGDTIALRESEYDYLVSGRFRVRGRGPLPRSLLNEPTVIITAADLLKKMYLLGLEKVAKRFKKIVAWRRDQVLPARTALRRTEPLKPRWDGMTLWYGDDELLSYRDQKEAPAQYTIWQALQDAGWPDNPVLLTGKLPSKYLKNLNKTISSINKRIKGKIIVLHARTNTTAGTKTRTKAVFFTRNPIGN